MLRCGAQSIALDDDSAFRKFSEADIEALLRADDGVMSALVRLVCRGVQALQSQRAATGAALQAKFATESKFAFETGSIDMFYRGLEGLLGPPAAHVMREIEREHTARPDSTAVFETSNGVSTTSATEFEFVVRPERAKAYPERSSLLSQRPKWRKPLSVDDVWEAIVPKNTALRQER